MLNSLAKNRAVTQPSAIMCLSTSRPWLASLWRPRSSGGRDSGSTLHGGRVATHGTAHFPAGCQKLRSGNYQFCDDVRGTGGMLTVAEETLTQLAREQATEASVHLYAHEVSPET